MGILAWMLVLLSVLLALGAAMFVTGMFLPKTKIVARSMASKASVSQAWQLISDFQNLPAWHPEVIRVERLPDHYGREVWRETYKDGSLLKLETVERLPPRRLVRRLADAKGPFAGQWEFEITAVEEGCRLTITEKGQVPNPLFRLLFGLFMNPTRSLENYLTALAVKPGEAAAVEATAALPP
jgi:hypothetical protein